jgi:glyoxylase-like metal-dependent hydrolase (beta-lactamase superfamily II)/predicted ester cyclase
VGPDGVRAYFSAVFAAFPDFTLEVLECTSARQRTAVRWRARGTFAGPGTFEGFAANGAKIEIEGCDVLTVVDDQIQHNDAYLDSGAIARQLGFLPPAGSKAERRLQSIANLRTRLVARTQGSEPERIADGVWLIRGGFPSKTMNVYLIEDQGGVTVFDAGISAMSPAVRSAAARLGGIRRVVLGHADADHRGAAPGLGMAVHCHQAERQAAESADWARPYHDFSKLGPHGRFALPRLMRVWDGGPVTVAGTVSEGDDIAGFRVVDLPGHAPGLIGLFRDSDRVALVSDCIYTLDPQTGIKGPARVPHPAFNIDTDQARDSIRKLARLEPSVAWAGHADPVRADVVAQLDRAAAAH